MSTEPTEGAVEVIDPDGLDRRDRYQLLTSLVVPRPIGWISTYGRDRTPNLAPYSFFAALSATPMLVGMSVGRRQGEPKDTLVNVRVRGGFCVNVVTRAHLEAMNSTSGDHPPDVDEFEVAGLDGARAGSVDAPYVVSAPAVLECSLEMDVDLPGGENTLLIGRVRAVRLAALLDRIDGTRFVDTRSLDPVGRLWGGAYTLGGDIEVLSRPRVS